MNNYVVGNQIMDNNSDLVFKQLDLSIIDHIKYEKSNLVIADYSKRNLLNIGKQFNQYLRINNFIVDANSIKGFLENLKLSQASPTWNLSRQNLKKLIKHQAAIGGSYLLRVFVDEIFNEIRLIRTERSVTTFLTQEQITTIVTQSTIRTGLVVEFLFKTGCRISELINVRIIDIRCDKQVRIRLIGKGAKERTVHIDYQLYEKITNEFQGKLYLFENRNHHRLDRSNLYRNINYEGKKNLGLNIHPHTLRHSTANYLLLSCGKSANYVAEYLGHSSPAITLEMYIHENPGSDVVDLFNQ